MKRHNPLRQLTAISDKEKQHFFNYIFEKNKERSDIIRLARTDHSQSDKDVIIAVFPEIKRFIFRMHNDSDTGENSITIKMAHYLRACHWLRSRGFEIPVGLKNVEQ